MQALMTITKWAAESWRKEKEIGTLEPGKMADLITVNGDPLADIDSLADPQHIRLVIKNGVVAHDFRERAGVAQPSSASSPRAAS